MEAPPQEAWALVTRQSDTTDQVSGLVHSTTELCSQPLSQCKTGHKNFHS
jgi:hypothetical protein